MKIRFRAFTVSFLALMLAAALCFSACAYGETVSNAYVRLTLNVEREVSVTEGGKVLFFRFSPSVSGDYLFCSTGSADTFGLLYDQSGNIVKTDDDSGAGQNFSVACTLTAGTDYTFGARLYSAEDTGSFGVVIRRDNKLTASSVGESYRLAEPGAALSFEVSASCQSGTLSYQWYIERYSQETENYGRELIRGATEPSLTAAAGFCGSYVCVVTDDYGGSAEVAYAVEIDNALSARPFGGQSLFSVAYGEQIRLQLEAACTRGGLHYRWICGEDDAEVGSDEPFCRTRPVTERCWYACEVTDDYGNSRLVHFAVEVDNELTVRPNGVFTVYIDPGETVTLSIRASCLRGNIRYTWSDGGEEPLSEDTGPSSDYTLQSPTKTTNLLCKVEDDYGNSREVRYAVIIDNDFHAERLGDELVSTAPNGSVLLEVTASCRRGALHYTWAGPGGGIDGAESASCRIEDVSFAADYNCTVEDDYGNRLVIPFHVEVENALTAVPAGGTVFIADAGDSVSLEVRAGCRNGALHYAWYRMMSDYDERWPEMLEGQTEAVLTVPARRPVTYLCEVSDDYGNTAQVFFLAAAPDLMLPSSLTALEAEAFAGVKNVLIWVPASVTEIGDGAFDESATILSEADSHAAHYAADHGLSDGWTLP